MPHTLVSAAPAPKSIRELMPKGFIKTLCLRTGCMYPSTLSTAIALENTGSTYWPAILQLAEETDPKGFATWQAANIPAVPAAH